jgi:BirA family biotin operon repressor/biotin-[acetyl-CoA-carboxylase] ligase
VADFNLSAIEKGLSATPFAGRVVHHRSTPSTNTLALEAAQEGAPHGSVWVADEQTSGRGRGGHQWHSKAADGLYVSVLLRPKMALADALWLSLATGLAVQSAIEDATGLKTDIRWPNDLLIDGKKCGGVLVETSTSSVNAETILRYAVIGVGINVNHEGFPPELKDQATSLRQHCGTPVARDLILVEFLLSLEKEVSLLEAELRGQFGNAGLLERFAAASSWVRGKRVRVDENGGYTGVTEGLDTRGFLRVAGDDGVSHTVLSGGVRPQ